MNYYHYIFYIIYKKIKFEREAGAKALVTVYFLSIIQGFNFSSVLMLFKVYFNLSFDTKLYSLIIFFIITLINSYIFFIKKGYKRIEEDFNKISEKFPRKTKIMFSSIIIYIIISILLLIFAVLMEAVNGDVDFIINWLKNYL